MEKDDCIKLLRKNMTILKNKYGITSLSLLAQLQEVSRKRVATLIYSLIQRHLILSC